MKLTKTQLKKMIREAVKEQLDKDEQPSRRQRPARSTTTKKVPSHIQARWDKRAKSGDSTDKEPQLSEAGGERAAQMMSQIIQASGPENFSQEFIDRMGPELEDDIRAVLSYVARRLGVNI